MKFFNLSFILLSLCISCSDLPPSAEIANFTTSRDTIVSPVNSANPYDVAGQLHTMLYTSYYRDAPLFENIPIVTHNVEQLAQKNQLFMDLASTNFPILSNDRITSLSSPLLDRQTEVLNLCFSSIQAKTSMHHFIETLLLMCRTEEEYAVLHDFIVAYELTIMENTSLGSSDKEIILISTSIARHSVYESKKRPKKNTDPEWDLMVGNICGGVEGATESLEKAVLMSLIVGIVENAK